MSKLTTHVLDTASGKPAGGMRVDVYQQRGGLRLIKTVVTNGDGRVDGALLDGAAEGGYQLVFHVAEYFRAQGHADAGKFLDEVAVAFVMSEGEGKYHVPLLVSPWAYSTYRGS